jgi:hypothetical protein
MYSRLKAALVYDLCMKWNKSVTLMIAWGGVEVKALRY